MEKWRYSSTILELGTRWELAVRFTPQPLYSLRNSPQYALYIGMDGDPRAGLEDEKNLLLLFRNVTPIPLS
jgi:hypothetical protein